MSRKVLSALIYISVVSVASVELSKNGTDSDPQDCDQTMDSEACGYGKRFYGLSKYSTEPDTNALDLCYSVCNDSYVGLYQKAACERGCKLQVAAEKDRQDKLTEYEMNGDEIIRMARLNQLWSHWMFEMLTGFDVFNDWYSDYDDSLESQSDMSTYVVIEQNDDMLSISTYKVSGAQNSPETKSNDKDIYTPLLSGTAQTELEEDECDDFYFMTYYTWYVLCLLLVCSSLTLVWLMCCVMTTSRRRRLVKRGKAALKEKDMLLDFKVSDSKPATVHQCQDDVPMLKA